MAPSAAQTWFMPAAHRRCAQGAPRLRTADHRWLTRSGRAADQHAQLSTVARPCTVTRKFRSPSGAACAFVQGPFELLTLAKRTTPGAQSTPPPHVARSLDCARDRTV